MLHRNSWAYNGSIGPFSAFTTSTLQELASHMCSGNVKKTEISGEIGEIKEKKTREGK